MPLIFPSDRKPDFIDASFSKLRCLDTERRRVVRLYVHTGALHRIGASKGVAANVIDEDLSNYLAHFLEDILADASRYYDAHPEPKPTRVEIGRIGIFAPA
jgi:hypothetical protein